MDVPAPSPHPPGPDGGLYRAKARAARALDPVVAALVDRGVPADVVTWVSLGAAAALAALTAAVLSGADSRLAVAALPLAVLRLATAVLDGEVARRAGTSRPEGAVLGEVVDRAGDAALLGALAVVHLPAAAVAVALALLADSVAAVGWAVTGTRSFPGVGGKPDRTALVGVGATAAALWPSTGAVLPWLALALTGANLLARGAAVRSALRDAGGAPQAVHGSAPATSTPSRAHGSAPATSTPSRAHESAPATSAAGPTCGTGAEA